MSLSDSMLIEKYKIQPTDKVLDVGGSMKQHPLIKIDTLVDVIHPEEAPYGRTQLKAKHFVRLDITRERFPFKYKEFDFCFCTHTLEDLAYPFLAIEEMSRVAKRGLIVTPSMGQDMVFSRLNFTDWLTGARRVPGLGHHKWLFYENARKMVVVPKNYPLLYSSEFHFTGWAGDEEFKFYWEGNIVYEEVRDLDFHKLITEYRKYIKSQRAKLKRGKVILYLDNPVIYLKELMKLLLKRGKGFSRPK